jgi:hypothetical protein
MSACDASPLRMGSTHEPWNSWRKVDNDVPNTCKPKILDHEVSPLQSEAVWHVLAVGFVS